MVRLTMSELPKWEEVSPLRSVAGDAARQMILNAEQQCAPLGACLRSLAEHPQRANWSSLVALTELVERAYVLAVESALDE